jgi:hypothetical protein
MPGSDLSALASIMPWSPSGLTGASVRGIFATGLAREVNGWPTRTRLERVFVIPAKPLAASWRRSHVPERFQPCLDILLCTTQIRL